ncbi:ester cyclase [Limnovirga soli]|uniref:Ester cyclase n=1 Tax=Limnovirga soli TaxID=2656915 RepID=A0A8J8JTM4_9BACT|nr:ester cyclase [Limnovirga soli]NNV54754.1 hypothetical protein [Limnovirga soli]
MKRIAAVLFVSILFVFSSCSQQNAIETRQVQYRHICDALFNKYQLQIIDTAFGANFSYHNGATNITGKAAAKAYYTAFFTSFSNGQLEILEMYEQGDKVISRWLFTGFHTSAYQGISATGVRVTVEGVSIARIAGNLLTEERVYMNDLALLQQIGGVAVIKK